MLEKRKYAGGGEMQGKIRAEMQREREMLGTEERCLEGERKEKYSGRRRDNERDCKAGG